MSESKASVLPVVPPEFSVSAGSQIVVDVPSNNVRYISVPSANGLNASKVNFTVDVSPNTLVQSNVSMRFPCEFKITGPYIKASDDSKMPVMPQFQSGFSKNSLFNIIKTQTITINQQTITVSPHEIVQALTDYLPYNRSNSELTTWHNYPDVAPTYKEILEDGKSNAYNSPFVGDELCQWGKRSFVEWDLVSGTFDDTKEGLHIKGVITIPIIGVACFTAVGQSKPLAHLQRLQVSLDLATTEAYKLFSRIEAQEAKAATTKFNVAMSFYEPPQLLYCTVEPPPMVKPLLYNPDGTAIPQDYNHNQLNYLASNSGFTEIKDQDSADLYATASLATTPSTLYVWVERGGATGNDDPARSWVESPEIYGLIQDLEVDINNKRNVFTGADVLYKISAKNGLSLPRAVAMKAGFVVKLDLSVDCSMGEFFTGSNTHTTLSIKVRAKNTRKFQLGAAANGAVPFRLNIITVNNQLLRLVDGSRATVFDKLITEDVKEQLLNKRGSYQDAAAIAPVHVGGKARILGGNSDGFGVGGAVGGAWWDSIWSGIKKVANVVSPIAQTVSSVASKVGDVSKMISAAGPRGGYKAGTTNLQQMV